MSGKLGVGYKIRVSKIEDRKGQSSHFKKTEKTQGATTEQIKQIRTLQNKGLKRCKVREQFPDISDHSFKNIWLGVTAAHIVPDGD